MDPSLRLFRRLNKALDSPMRPVCFDGALGKICDFSTGQEFHYGNFASEVADGNIFISANMSAVHEDSGSARRRSTTASGVLQICTRSSPKCRKYRYCEVPKLESPAAGEPKRKCAFPNLDRHTRPAQRENLRNA